MQVKLLAVSTRNMTAIEHPRQRKSHFRLSLVVPIFNEENSCESFFDRAIPVLKEVTDNFEIVCVNDGSTDRSLEMLQRLHASDSRIKIVDLTRNFGKELALTAGLELATGDAVIPIDADLQDPPELIPKFVERWREGFDMVVAVRDDRRSDSWLKRTTSHLFYRVIGRIGDVPVPSNAGDYRLIDRTVVEVLKRLPERNRFMKGIFAWVGFRQATVTYTRPARAAGESKWGYWKLWNFALEGIFSMTTLPLRVWTYFGVGIAFLAGCYGMFIIVRTLLFGADVAGYPSLFVAILFFSGINMVGLGILGEYVGRIFVEVKQRPLYLINDTIGFEEPPRDLKPAPDSSPEV
jgi:glycosyltransferase involved in cell wall biosynthesis